MNDTQRISAEELKELHKKVEESEEGPELTVNVTPQMLARLDAVLMHMEDNVSYQEAVRAVFVRGLEAFESDD